MADNEFPPIWSNQSEDLPFTSIKTMHGTVGRVYSRSYDSAANHVEGQDYFVFRDGEDRFCFALCDGVGQSYYGQLAAKLLGDRLFDWLENLPPEDMWGKDLDTRLTSAITEFSSTAQTDVLRYELPKELPDLVLLALQEQKEYGSETVFVAGRIDFSTKYGLPLLNIFWLGDAEFHMFDSKPSKIPFNSKWVNSERWSTVKGIKGAEKVHHWSSELPGVRRLIVHSDGLRGIDRKQLGDLVDGNEQLTSEIERLRSLPESDDISLISIDFSYPSDLS